MKPAPRVGCFSYLAAVQTLHVDHFPALNYGVDVERSDQFLAGDGPLVAGALAALGHEAELASNQVGDDAAGRAIAERLRRWGVTLTPGPVVAKHTRVNIVACDADGNRTWFSQLKGIEAELVGLEQASVATAPIVYLDCYEVLGETPQRVLAAALSAGSEVVINLGGSPPPAWLHSVTAGTRPAVLQTNADEHSLGDADRQLEELLNLGIADVVIVTAGRQGAVAGTSDGETEQATALDVEVQQVQGAGAVFSAGLIHSRGRGDSLARVLSFACASASLWCARSPDSSLPTEDEISNAQTA